LLKDEAISWRLIKAFHGDEGNRTNKGKRWNKKREVSLRRLEILKDNEQGKGSQSNNNKYRK
jgi:hypothetical protein